MFALDPESYFPKNHVHYLEISAFFSGVGLDADPQFSQIQSTVYK